MGDFFNSGSSMVSALKISIQISWVKADTEFVVCFSGKN